MGDCRRTRRGGPPVTSMRATTRPLPFPVVPARYRHGPGALPPLGSGGPRPRCQPPSSSDRACPRPDWPAGGCDREARERCARDSTDLPAPGTSRTPGVPVSFADTGSVSAHDSPGHCPAWGRVATTFVVATARARRVPPGLVTVMARCRCHSARRVWPPRMRVRRSSHRAGPLMRSLHPTGAQRRRGPATCCPCLRVGQAT